MAVETGGSTLTPALQRRILEHKEEMARLREEFGDPEEALRAFMREAFDPQALQETYEEYLRNPFAWLEGEDGLESDGR